MILEGINGKNIETGCERVTFQIISDSGTHDVKNAVTVPDLKLPSQSVSREHVRVIAKTSSVFIQPYKDVMPKVLICQDHWRLLSTIETREISGTSAVLSLSALGWAVHGLVSSTHVYSDFTVIARKSSNEELKFVIENLNKLVKQYFEVDNFGVNENAKTVSKHDRSLEILKSTSKCLGNVWETGLIWKNNEISQVDSRATALKRLHTVEKRLDRDAAYAMLYYREMERFISSGYAVKVDEEVSGPRVWYLPHFGVTNPNKPGTLRLVFDAAAKTSGICLNDQLDPGPDLLQSLPGVLLRFRQFSIAVKADIKDMFLRVRVIEKDRGGALRFLWRGENRQKSAETYEMTCIVFGFADEKPVASKSIIINSYMDDYLASSTTVEKASILVQDVIQINQRANFNMHGWASNNKRVFDKIDCLTNKRKNERAPLCDRGGGGGGGGGGRFGSFLEYYVR